MRRIALTALLLLVGVKIAGGDKPPAPLRRIPSSKYNVEIIGIVEHEGESYYLKERTRVSYKILKMN